MAVEFIEVATQVELDRAVADGNIPVCRSGFFTAFDSAQVRAFGSARVTAFDSAQVTASDGARVTAFGSAQVRAFDSAQVEASKFVAVTRHGDAVKIAGGVIIDIPPITTAQDFCDFYGLDVKRGAVVVYKLVNDEFVSGHHVSYRPGEKPVASDWDGGKDCCGGGLHFSPRPFMARHYSSGTRFVACRVRLADMVAITDYNGGSDKCKAKGCTVLFECDEDGVEIAAAAAA